MKLNRILFAGLILTAYVMPAQEKTVGLLEKTSEVSEGYILFHPIPDNNIYLIDNCGRLINKWETDYRPGHSVYLQPDGSIYFQGAATNPFINAGGAGGAFERHDWNGTKQCRYVYSDGTGRAHHDYQVLPNGNLLILAWEYKTKEEAIANGRNPDLMSEDALWPEQIFELEPTGEEGGNIVWSWHAWDHMVQDFDETKSNYGVIADNPGKININYFYPGEDVADWQHANALNYNAELDQIMISVLNFDEIWIIDHNTTTEEARGEKGDLLFRWGNPEAYGRGTIDDKQLHGQHDAKWIEPGLPDEGKIMVFNNGRGRPDGQYTSIIKLDPTIQNEAYQMNQDGHYLPESPFYEYTAPNPTDFYSRFLSGAQQLPNGNILVNSGAFGTFFEFNEQEEIVWKYVSPITFGGPAEQGTVP
ncbi:MAG: aryl-sulfate sulfotransferase, partial [Cyclobacteriaceae bacterium]